MSNLTQEQIEDLSKKLADEGKLIEAGFVALRVIYIPHNAPETQVREMRIAFMCGAQHLFSSLFSIMEAGSEPTEGDMNRMEMIHAEMDAFVTEMKVKGAPKG